MKETTSTGAIAPVTPVSGKLTPDAAFDSVESIHLAHASKRHNLSLRGAAFAAADSVCFRFKSRKQ
ncbi:hypothetical protein [Alistipes putredinis]|jgi:hypothetical protein|uniref:hypothetical protein n=1 Tax=Alistipes putredinis TaxID=28117 RepID=UPI0035230295